jgi:hypothetical protein
MLASADRLPFNAIERAAQGTITESDNGRSEAEQ